MARFFLKSACKKFNNLKAEKNLKYTFIKKVENSGKFDEPGCIYKLISFIYPAM